MSAVYIERINAVEDQMIACRVALFYVDATWNDFISMDRTPMSRGAVAALPPKQTFASTLNDLETTFLVRLTAEFEGILKDHLRTNHRSVAFPVRMSDWKVDWFLNRIRANEPAVHIDATLRRELDAIRDYRNDVAHQEQRAARVTFKDARKRYNRFLRMLPDPRT